VSDSSWEVCQGGLKLQEVYFHKDSSVEVCRDLYFDTNDARPNEAIMLKKIYTRGDICSLLADCGFRIEEIYGNWDLAPFSEKEAKMLITASPGRKA